jgi:hypothetical protein
MLDVVHVSLMYTVKVVRKVFETAENPKKNPPPAGCLRRRLRRARSIFTKKHIHFWHLIGAGPQGSSTRDERGISLPTVAAFRGRSGRDGSGGFGCTVTARPAVG